MFNPSEWSYSRQYHDVWRRIDTTDLQAGTIIVAERKPWRLADIRPRPHINWNPDYLAVWEKHGRPDPEKWPYRPFMLILVPELGNDRRERHCEVGGAVRWAVLPEHFSVCRLCGELPPCRHEYNEAIMEHATEKMDEAMQILPGACHACKELIRPRQGTIRFEGENLIRPDLGNGSAVFHTRRQCFDEAFRYDEKWAVAERGRQGKLHCTGRAVHHFDGSMECSLGIGCAGPLDATGGQLQHRGGEVWHSAGRGYADGCWCTSGGPRPASVTAGADNDKLF